MALNFARAVADALDPAGTADHQRQAALEQQGHQAWLTALFPHHVTDGFAPHHEEFWEWVDAIEPDRRPDLDFVGIWNRGGAKSTSAELAVAKLGATRRRRYVLYVCRTQDQADDHVTNIGALLEAGEFGDLYPACADRAVGKYGNSKGWRVNRLRTRSGFTVDAVGLDTAARGVKLDDARPDLIVLDDIDHPHDSAATVAKNRRTITDGLLPAGAGHLAVVAIQNLIRDDGIFADLAGLTPDGPTFLTRRILSGPIPALTDFEAEARPDGGYTIRGNPTWDGFDLERCQAAVDKFGLTAFLTECQHDVTDPPGGMFDHLDYRRCDDDEVPDLVRVAVAVDPAVTATDDSDACGIQADGLAADGRVFRLFSWEERATPLDVLKLAVVVAFEYQADTVVVETDQGGDTWEQVWERAVEAVLDDDDNHVYRGRAVPAFKQEKAGSVGPKVERAARMLAGYELGWFVHVRGDHALLERALARFPVKKPFDLVDAAYWSARELRPDIDRRVSGRRRLAEAA